MFINQHLCVCVAAWDSTESSPVLRRVWFSGKYVLPTGQFTKISKQNWFSSVALVGLCLEFTQFHQVLQGRS